MNDTPPSAPGPLAAIAAFLESRRDAIGALFIVVALVTAVAPLWTGAVGALIMLAALLLALTHARTLVADARTPMRLPGHATAVVGATLICLFFMARYVGYIGFRTQIVPSILLILTLGYLIPLRRVD